MCFVLQVSAWGGYVFIINLIPLHVFVLLLMQRFSRRLYIGESPVLCVCLCERLCFLYEVHTSPPTQSRHVVLVLPYNNEAWTCFFPLAFWFGHTEMLAQLWSLSARQHESLSLHWQQHLKLTLRFNDTFFPPTSLLPFTTNHICNADLRMHVSLWHRKSLWIQIWCS